MPFCHVFWMSMEKEKIFLKVFFDLWYTPCCWLAQSIWYKLVLWDNKCLLKKTEMIDMLKFLADGNKHIMFYSCQPRSRIWGHTGHRLTEPGQLKIRKRPGDAQFCEPVYTVASVTAIPEIFFILLSDVSNNWNSWSVFLHNFMRCPDARWMVGWIIA